MPIQEVKNYLDDEGRTVTMHIDVENGEKKYMGHGQLGVAAIRQIVPYAFPIEADNVIEAFSKFEASAEAGKPAAEKQIRDAITNSQHKIVVPGAMPKIDNKVIGP